MRNSNSSLLVIGALGLIWYFSRTGSAVSNLLYEATGVRLIEIKPLQVKVELDLVVSNPSRIALKFSQFFGTLSYQGSTLATIQIPQKVDIPALTRKTIHIPFSISTVALLSKGINLAKTKQLADLHLNGSLKLNGAVYPVDEVFQLNNGQ